VLLWRREVFSQLLDMIVLLQRLPVLLVAAWAKGKWCQ